MSWLARIEEACAAFIERTFAKTFPSDLEPAQIARKLVATMEARTQNSDGEMTAPSAYSVTVSPQDFERLAPHARYLEAEWAALLKDVAERVGIVFVDGEARIELGVNERVVSGAMEVDAGDTDVTHPPARHFLLRMVKGVPADAIYLLGERTRVGRSDEREVFLVDPSVSRNHAVIEMHNGVPVLHDVASTNGTYVNGERVTKRRLSAGDLVAFGNTQLRLEVQDA